MPTKEKTVESMARKLRMACFEMREFVMRCMRLVRLCELEFHDDPIQEPASSKGHWRRKRARPKYTRIPATMAASEANIGRRPVEMKMAIHPAIASRTGTG